MLTIPAHPDVGTASQLCATADFRLVTLTNSPPNPDGPSPLGHRGWATCRATAQRRELPSVQARAGGVLARVRAARRLPTGLHDGGRPRLGHHRRPVRRFSGALITRPGNAVLPLPGLAAADRRGDRPADLAGNPQTPRYLAGEGGPPYIGIQTPKRLKPHWLNCGSHEGVSSNPK